MTNEPLPFPGYVLFSKLRDYGHVYVDLAFCESHRSVEVMRSGPKSIFIILQLWLGLFLILIVKITLPFICSHLSEILVREPFLEARCSWLLTCRLLPLQAERVEKIDKGKRSEGLLPCACATNSTCTPI